MSPHIQRHFVRLYTHKGYLLLAGNPSEGFARQDLDVASEAVPASYLKAQRRLDSVLPSRRLPWPLCLLWDDPQRRPIVAYGTFVDLPNERGELHGVFFVHAVEATGPASLVSLVEGVVRQLSPAGLQKLLQGIEEVAAGGRDAESFAVQVSRWLEERCPPGAPPITVPAAEGVGFIAHDRAGSAPVAWLAMAAVHAKLSPPWEVADVPGPGDQIGTWSLEHGKVRGGGSATVSRLLSRVDERRAEALPKEPPAVQDTAAETVSLDAGPKPIQEEERAEAAPPARRRYMAFALVGFLLCVSLVYSLDRTKQSEEGGGGLARMEDAEARLAALEKNLAELKEWRERMEGRELIQRVLAREAGALDEARRLWERDPEWLRLFLEEVRRNKHRKEATLDVVLALDQTDAGVLSRSQKDVVDFLDDVAGNGRKTGLAVQAVRDRLGLL